MKTNKMKAMTGGLLVFLFLIMSASQIKPVAAAGDDGFEDNDTINSAAKISEGKYTMISWDQDYFNITIPGNYSLRVYITYDAGQYLSLQIFNGSSLTMMNATFSYTGDIESSSSGNIKTMNQIINVSGQNIGFKYTMTVELIPFVGYDDLFEPNDFINSVVNDFPINKTLTHLVLADFDWYSFYLTPNMKYHILLTFENPLNGIYLQFYNMSYWMFNDTCYDWEYSVVLDYDQVGSTCNFSVSSGLYSLSDYYSIRIQGGSDDTFEENDDKYNAKFVNNGYYENLSLWDEDWYYVPSMINTAINFTILNLVDSKTYLTIINISDDSQIAFDNIADDGQLSITYSNTGPFNQSLYFHLYSNSPIGQKYGILINTNSLNADDAYENNDQYYTSAYLNIGPIYSSMKQFDLDWFNVTASMGTFFNISVTCPINAMINLTYVMWPSLTPIATDSSTYDGFLNIIYNSTSPDFELFYIDGFNTGVEYSVQIKAMNASSDDWCEENDWAEAAYNFGPGQYGPLVSKDVDWYWVNAGQWGLLSINVSCSSMNGFGLYIYNNDTTNCLAYDTSNSDGFLNISTYVSAGFWYRFQVYSDYTGTSYVLGISFNYDDNFEENDNSSIMASISTGFYGSLKSFDEDWYSFYASPSTNLTIKMTFPIYTEFGLILYKDYNMTLTMTDYTTTDGVLQVYGITSSYCYFYIRVVNTGPNYIGQSYNLNISTSSYTPQSTDDIYEDNDQMSNANLLNYWQVNNLIQKDDDWFRMNINTIGNYVLEFNWSVNYIDLEIYTPSGNRIHNNQYNGTFANVSFYAGMIGNFYFHFGGSNSGVIYSFQLKSTESQNFCNDDQYEDNDSPQTARIISFPVNANLTLCDADYYRISIEGGRQIKFIIRIATNTKAQLVLLNRTVYSSNYTQVRFDDTTYDGELSFEVTLATTSEIVFGLIPQQGFSGSVSYIIEANYINGTSNSNDLENPFGELPGYPIEIMGSISILVLFVGMKKQKRKIVE